MHALFPEVLFLGPYVAPLVLRVGVALYFLLHARALWLKGTEKSKLLAAKEAAFGVLFLAGFLTQLVAIGGILVVLFRGMWLKSDSIKEAWSSKAVAVAAQLALIMTGAGVFAIDLPY